MKKILFLITILMGYIGFVSGCGAKGEGFAPSSIAEPGTLAFSTSSFNFGAALAGQITQATVQVLHTGGAVTVVSGGTNSPFRYKGGSFPGVGGTCSTTISSNCTLVVNFEPVSAGSFSANLSLTYTSLSLPSTINLSLSGSATLPSPTDLLITGSNSVQANQCVAFTVNSVVLPNINSPVATNTTVNLAVNSGTGTFFSNITCSSSLSSVVIPSGQSSVTVYFRSTTAPQTPTLVTSAASLQSGTKVISVTNAATQLAVTAPPQIQINSCRLVTVARLDASNLPVASLSSQNINVSASGSTQIFSNSSCTAQVSSATIASGSSSVSLYVRGSAVESVNFVASDPTATLSSATEPIQVVNTLNWWNTSYSKRIQITLDNSDQTVAFANQAVLVRLNSGIAGYSNFNSDGSDIRFTLDDHSTVLDHQIDSWNVNGNSYVWIRIPNVPSANTMTVFMYFGNNSASSGENIAPLWTRYSSVWHLQESAAGAAPQFRDSTAAAKNGTAQGGPVTATGIIGNALDLNGNNDVMDVGSLLGTLGGTATLSFWVKTAQTGNNTNFTAPGVTGIEQMGGVNDIFWGWIDASGFIGVTAGNGVGAKSNLAINDNVWRHISITRNASTGGVSFYVNGVLNNSGTSGSGLISTDFSKFGIIPSTAGGGYEFDGTLDEIRIINSVLTADEVKAEFKFQNNSHVSFGSIETY